MSVAVFVLNVEEFLPLVAHARERGDIRVSGPLPTGYYRLEAQGQMRIERRALGFKHAVWYGLLTGGLVGCIARFDGDELLLQEEGA